MQNLNVGIIGYGRIGAEHAGWMAAAPGVNARAAFDVTPARRELAAARGMATYDDLLALLAETDIEAVLISTPTARHFEQAMLALEANKHVMVEKPMALDLKQSRRLVHEARSRNKVLSVFHNRRWDPDYLTVRQAIESGVLGKLINVESRLGQFASCVGPAAREYRPGWRNEAEYGGGGLYDWGSHFVDQIWRLLWPARPVRVFAQLRGNVWTRDCDDFARILIDFDSGVVGLCEINTTTTRPLPRWHLDGSRGSASAPASLSFDTAEWARLEFTSVEGIGATTLLPMAPAGLSEIGIWEQFAAAIGGTTEPAVTAASVLPTMALLDAARQSSRHQEAVDVRDVVEWIYR
jgi:scyllo-inositol 2-dehydrogenase (NADP+)